MAHDSGRKSGVSKLKPDLNFYRTSKRSCFQSQHLVGKFIRIECSVFQKLSVETILKLWEINWSMLTNFLNISLKNNVLIKNKSSIFCWKPVKNCYVLNRSFCRYSKLKLTQFLKVPVERTMPKMSENMICFNESSVECFRTQNSHPKHI